MHNRFMSGMITGSVIGATTGMYAYKKMSPRQRKMMMRRGRKIIEGATNIIDMAQSVNMFR